MKKHVLLFVTVGFYVCSMMHADIVQDKLSFSCVEQSQSEANCTGDTQWYYVYNPEDYENEPQHIYADELVCRRGQQIKDDDIMVSPKKSARSAWMKGLLKTFFLSSFGCMVNASCAGVAALLAKTRLPYAKKIGTVTSGCFKGALVGCLAWIVYKRVGWCAKKSKQYPMRSYWLAEDEIFRDLEQQIYTYVVQKGIPIKRNQILVSRLVRTSLCDGRIIVIKPIIKYGTKKSFKGESEHIYTVYDIDGMKAHALHEAKHLRDKHLQIWCAMTMLEAASSLFLPLRWVWTSLMASAGIAKFYEHCEVQADKQIEKYAGIHELEGAIDDLSKYQGMLSRDIAKHGTGSAIDKYLGFFVDPHPAIDDRIKNLQDIVDKKKQNLV